MTIVTQCPKCGKRLKAPDQQVGRQARCPQCKADFTIKAVECAMVPATARPASDTQPGTAPQPASAAASREAAVPAAAAARTESVDKPEWYVQTADGVEYGPVTRADLDVWLAEDRLDKDCQILKEGWPQWQWAEELFPQLVHAAPAPPDAAAPPEADDDDDPLAGIGEAPVTASGGMAVVGRLGPSSSGKQVGSARVATVSSDEVSPRIVAALLNTRPWILLFSILAFVAAACAALGVVGAIFLMIASPMAGLGMLLAVATYVGVYNYFGYLLMKYANGCAVVARTRSATDLEHTLEAQRDFWKLAGILFLAVLGISLIGGLLVALFMNSLIPARGVALSARGSTD